MTAKTIKDYEEEIKHLETMKVGLTKMDIPNLKDNIENARVNRDKKAIEIANLKANFNAGLKLLTKQHNDEERERRKFSRELKEAKKELQGIPQRQSYCQLKIRRLKWAESSPPAKKEPKRKAKDGEGIESLGGLVCEESTLRSYPG